MKKVILMIITSLVVTGSAQAWIVQNTTGEYQEGLFNTETSCSGFYKTMERLFCRIVKVSSFPTIFVGDQAVDLKSAEGQAILVLEALKVVMGENSLLIVDDDNKSAKQKAEEILKAASETEDDFK